MFIEVLKNDVFKSVHEYEAYVFAQESTSVLAK